MAANGISADLEQWRASRESLSADPAALRDLLSRLQAWKAQHDRERAQQPGPFLQMAWDGVFGDEDAQVTQAIRQLEDALAR